MELERRIIEDENGNQVTEAMQRLEVEVARQQKFIAKWGENVPSSVRNGVYGAMGSSKYEKPLGEGDAKSEGISFDDLPDFPPKLDENGEFIRDENGEVVYMTAEEYENSKA